MPGTTARIHAPSTIGNFGPGFDVLGLALAERGDRVTLETAPSDELVIHGRNSETIPRAWDENCASVALGYLRTQFDVRDKHRLTIEKGVRPGSGLGSSASSSAGAALAFHALHGTEAGTTPVDLIEAAAAGEGRVAGRHRDDVACVVMGGLTAVRPTPDGGFTLARFEPPPSLVLAIALPDVVLETRRMRAVLPRDVPLEDAVQNLANVAHLLHAFARDDIEALGAALDDRIALPRRAPLVPAYKEMRRTALDAGAHGACLSGSGPATFAVCDSHAAAKRVAAAMEEALSRAGLTGETFTTEPCRVVPHEQVRLS